MESKFHPESIEAIKRGIASIPPEIMQELHQAGVRQHLKKSLTRFGPWVSEEWARREGLYSFSSKLVALAEYYKMGGQYHRSQRLSKVYRHEIGHAYDDVRKMASQRPGFQQAHAKDVAALPDLAKQDLAYFITGSGTPDSGLREAFAEAFASLVGGGVRGRSFPGRSFPAHFPESVNYVRQLLSAGNAPGAAVGGLVSVGAEAPTKMADVWDEYFQNVKFPDGWTGIPDERRTQLSAPYQIDFNAPHWRPMDEIHDEWLASDEYKEMKRREAERRANAKTNLETPKLPTLEGLTNVGEGRKTQLAPLLHGYGREGGKAAYKRYQRDLKRRQGKLPPYRYYEWLAMQSGGGIPPLPPLPPTTGGQDDEDEDDPKKTRVRRRKTHLAPGRNKQRGVPSWVYPIQEETEDGLVGAGGKEGLLPQMFRAMFRSGGARLGGMLGQKMFGSMGRTVGSMGGEYLGMALGQRFFPKMVEGAGKAATAAGDLATAAGGAARALTPLAAVGAAAGVVAGIWAGGIYAGVKGIPEAAEKWAEVNRGMSPYHGGLRAAYVEYDIRNFQSKLEFADRTYESTRDFLQAKAQLDKDRVPMTSWWENFKKRIIEIPAVKFADEIQKGLNNILGFEDPNGILKSAGRLLNAEAVLLGRAFTNPFNPREWYRGFWEEYYRDVNPRLPPGHPWDEGTHPWARLIWEISGKMPMRPPKERRAKRDAV